MTSTPPQPLSSWRERARTLYDRLPTKWLITGISAVLLGLSAVLGGLNDVAATPIPQVEAGEPYAGERLTITAERAALIDGFPEQGVRPADGNRLLVVVATVENTSNDPVRLATQTSKADTLLPVDVEFAQEATAPTAILVFDDGSTVATVQPGVPVEVAFVWEVPAGELSGGDELRVDLLDRTYQGEATVYFGDRFSDDFVAGYLAFTIEDLGAGAGG